MYQIVLASVVTVMLAALPALAAEYPDKKLAEIAKNGAYVGGDSCKACHADTHDTWKQTRHTMKARKGPAMGKEYYSNVFAWCSGIGTSWTAT